MLFYKSLIVLVCTIHVNDNYLSTGWLYGAGADAYNVPENKPPAKNYAPRK